MPLPKVVNVPCEVVDDVSRHLMLAVPL